MRRILLVLAVAAMLVTVLVFAAPAFAVAPDTLKCPAAGDEVSDIATTTEQPGKFVLDTYGVPTGEVVQAGDWCLPPNSPNNPNWPPEWPPPDTEPPA